MENIETIASDFEKYLKDKYNSKTFNEELFFDFMKFNYDNFTDSDYNAMCDLYKKVKDFILNMEPK